MNLLVKNGLNTSRTNRSIYRLMNDNQFWDVNLNSAHGDNDEILLLFCLYSIKKSAYWLRAIPANSLSLRDFGYLRVSLATEYQFRLMNETLSVKLNPLVISSYLIISSRHLDPHT